MPPEFAVEQHPQQDTKSGRSTGAGTHSAPPGQRNRPKSAQGYIGKPRPCKLNIDEINSMTSDSRPPFLDENSNARSKSITVADGAFTHGALNQLPARKEQHNMSFKVGVSEDRGPRRTMEDAHSFVVDFAGVRGQGYFAIFDGHAGKHAAEWCGAHFHEYLLESIAEHPDSPVPDLLNQTFHNVDKQLSKMAEEGQTHSGCTAVTTFLRIENAETGAQSMSTLPDGASGDPSKVTGAVKSLAEKARQGSDSQETVDPEKKSVKRVLYTANVGDARAVLCRSGKAIRLTYDHKGSDHMEAKRITDAGGFVMNNRVNGVLAVTRSLGDSSMKDFVVGSPYTTETELGDDDEFMIIACDGLWDVVDDQGAVELIRGTQDPQEASKMLIEHALGNFSSDNVSVLVVRFTTGR